MLANGPILVYPDAKSAFNDQDIHVGLGYLSLHDVPVLLTGVITGVEYFDAIDLNDEHGSTDDMACDIGGDFDAFFFQLDAEVDGGYLFHGVADLLLGEECLLVSDFQSVSHQVMVDVFSRFGHVYFLLVVVRGQEVR